jgi:hypothetical protein
MVSGISIFPFLGGGKRSLQQEEQVHLLAASLFLLPEGLPHGCALLPALVTTFPPTPECIDLDLLCASSQENFLGSLVTPHPLELFK